MQRSHTLAVTGVHVGSVLQQLFRLPEVAPFDRPEERRLALVGGIVDDRLVRGQEADRLQVMIVCRREEAVVRIAAQFQQMRGEGHVPAPGDGAPERSGPPRALGEGGGVDVEASSEQDVGRPDAVGWVQSAVTGIDHAAEVQPAAAAFVAETKQRRGFVQARADVPPLERPHPVQHPGL